MGDIATKLTTIAENQQKVYDAGYTKGQADGGDTEAAYQQGVVDGKQAEYDAFWDAYQENGNRADYKYAFAYGWNDDSYNPKYPIQVSDYASTNGIYRNTKITNTKVPLVFLCAPDYTVFANANLLETIVSIDASLGTTFWANGFGLVSLKNLTIVGGIYANANFQNCSLLTHDSLMSIINALGNNCAYTLTLGSTNIAKLTEEELSQIELKGWTYR